MASKHTRDFKDDSALRPRVVSSGRVGGVVQDVGGAGVVVAADDYEAIAMAAGQPGDDIEGGRSGATAMHERIEPYLESWNRFVLIEKEVTRGSDTMAGFGLVGARLPCPKILQGLGCVKDSVGVDVADDRIDFRIRADRTARRAGEYKGKGDD